jgi:catechol 2,3-dioxygenase-like lactoylglutathione lyase family enzyme
MFKIESIHPVSLPVRNKQASESFYEEVLGLKKIERPAFGFDGAWYQLGDRQLHLICHDRSTFREGKPLDSRDIHFAVRITSFRETKDFLLSKGYSEQPQDEAKRMKINLPGPDRPPWPQIYIIDPDGNVIELNAERDDSNDDVSP